MDSVKNEGQSFIKGTLTLLLANFVVKIIGAIFKIPLANLVGKAGMGYFGVAYQIYTFLFIISTAGFPIAISKMVAETRDDLAEAVRIFRVARWMLSIIGMAGAVLLFIFADVIAKMLGSSDASLGIKLICPAVYFISIVSAYRGYFQGHQNMYPTAISEVVEALGKLIIGYCLAHVITYGDIDVLKMYFVRLNDYGGNHIRVLLASGGATVGVTVGAFLALLSLLFIYWKSKSGGSNLKLMGSTRDILKELLVTATPIMIGAAVFSLTSLIDLMTVMNRLVANPSVFDRYSKLFVVGTKFAENAIKNNWTDIQLLQEKANILYGMYTGFAMPIFNMPLTLVVALAISLVPAIAGAIAHENKTEGKQITESAIRLTMLFAAPCACGISFLAEPILNLIYHDTDSYVLLQKLSIAIIFVALVQVTNAIMQAYSRPYVPLGHMAIGGAAKIALNYFLIPIYGIDAAPIATNICYAIILFLNMGFILKNINISFNIMDFIVKPILSSILMSCCAFYTYRFLEKFFSGFAVIVSIFIGIFVYLIAILMTKAIKNEDILMLPIGPRVRKFVKKGKF